MVVPWQKELRFHLHTGRVVMNDDDYKRVEEQALWPRIAKVEWIRTLRARERLGEVTIHCVDASPHAGSAPLVCREDAEGGQGSIAKVTDVNVFVRRAGVGAPLRKLSVMHFVRERMAAMGGIPALLPTPPDQDPREVLAHIGFEVPPVLKDELQACITEGRPYSLYVHVQGNFMLRDLTRRKTLAPIAGVVHVVLLQDDRIDACGRSPRHPVTIRSGAVLDLEHPKYGYFGPFKNAGYYRYRSDYIYRPPECYRYKPARVAAITVARGIEIDDLDPDDWCRTHVKTAVEHLLQEAYKREPPVRSPVRPPVRPPRPLNPDDVSGSESDFEEAAH